MFLMYRVELKERGRDESKNFLGWFLMYRVELKDNLRSNKSRMIRSS